MEMLPNQRVFEDAEPPEADDISDRAVRREMLSRAIGNPFLNRATTLVPMAVILFASFQSPHPELLWLLLTAQLVAMMTTAVMARRAKIAIDSHQSAKQQVDFWLLAEVAAASIWGLMLIATANHNEPGVVSSVVAVAVLVTFTASVLVSTAAPGLWKAVIIGFAITAWPVVIYHFEAFGPMTGLAILFLIPGLWVLSATMDGRSFHALKSELENRSLTVQLAAALDTAEYLSRHDGLTGLLNRRDFERAAQQLRENRPNTAITIIALDLDRFKTINDRYGHAVGDSALISAANILRSQIRAADVETHAPDQVTSLQDEVIARWGGEEFILALALDASVDATAIAERICSALANHHDSDWPSGMTMTASFGLAEWAADETLHSAITRADLAMYDAKAAGRNCVRKAAA